MKLSEIAKTVEFKFHSHSLDYENKSHKAF